MAKQKAAVAEEQQYIPVDDNINYYRTFDLGAAAALISADFELVALDKMNPRKVQFIFRRTSGAIEEIADQYFGDRLEIKARTFFDNLKAIKNRLYSSD